MMALCGGCAAPRPEHVSPNGGGSGKPGLHFGDVTPQKSAPQEARHLQSGQLIGLPNREREILVWPVKPFKGYRTWIMRTTVRCSWVSIRLHEPKLRCPPWFELLTIGLASFLDRIIPSCISFLSHPHTNLVQLISNTFFFSGDRSQLTCARQVGHRMASPQDSNCQKAECSEGAFMRPSVRPC